MSSQRPFDLAKLDFEGIRKRKRKRLILFSLPIVIIVSLLALKLVSLSVLHRAALGNYNSTNYSGALRSWWPLRILNNIETYKVYFNEGDAYFMQQDYTKAKQSFEQALLLAPAPQHCKIHVNLVLTAETSADVQFSAKNYEQAIILYDQAKAALEAGSKCFREKQTTDAAQKLRQAEERVEDKSNQAKRERNQEQADPNKNVQPSDTRKELSDSQQQQLQDIQQKAQSERYLQQRQELQRRHDRTSGNRQW